MLSDDLLKTDWDVFDIHFSSDRRIDQEGLIHLSNLRHVKRLTLYQDGVVTKFHTPTMFGAIHLNKLNVQHLVIHSKNFRKTKALLHAMRLAQVSIVEIVFDNVPSVEPNGSFGMPISKIISPSHAIFTNIHQRDAHNIKWLLDKFEDLSTIWLQVVHPDVEKLYLVKYIDNLHVCVGFPFQVIDQIKIRNLYIHANSFADLANFEEKHLLPLTLESDTPSLNNKTTRNVIVEMGPPSPSYLIKVYGRDVYDLHVTRGTYNTHKEVTKHKSLVQHKNIPTNWAMLYMSVR